MPSIPTEQRNDAQADAQAKPQASPHRNATTWRKGQSGNPKGSAFPAGALRAAEEQLLAAILEDVGGELNALDMALATQAAAQLARAEFTKAPDIKVRLTRGACALIDRVRNSVAARRERRPLSAFDEYVAQRGAKP